MLTLNFPEVTEDLLSQMVQDIVQKFRPKKIILFGSYAWGTPRKDSDVDLLVIMESDRRPPPIEARKSVLPVVLGGYR